MPPLAVKNFFAFSGYPFAKYQVIGFSGSKRTAYSRAARRPLSQSRFHVVWVMGPYFRRIVSFSPSSIGLYVMACVGFARIIEYFMMAVTFVRPRRWNVAPSSPNDW